MIVKTATPLRIYFSTLRAKWRVVFGFCPMCNSDAPAIYDCPLCEGYHSADNGLPSVEKREKWLSDYIIVLKGMARTRKLVAEHRQKVKE